METSFRTPILPNSLNSVGSDQFDFLDVRLELLCPHEREPLLYKLLESLAHPLGIIFSRGRRASTELAKVDSPCSTIGHIMA